MATISHSCSAGWPPILDQDFLAQVSLSQIPVAWPPKSLTALIVGEEPTDLKAVNEGNPVQGEAKDKAEDEILLGALGGKARAAKPTGRPVKPVNDVEVEATALARSALPHGWEQFLNVKTGEIFYVEWSSCRRARHDPREVQRQVCERWEAGLRQLEAMVKEMVKQLQQSEAEEEGGEGVPIENSDNDEPLFKGCQSCLKFVYCPHRALGCPTCGSTLLIFTSSSPHSN